MIVNLVVAGLTVFGIQYVSNNDYIDKNTIVLALLLSLQTHIALVLERRRRDPFIILLASTTIFYFSFRIFTLALYPFSIVFERYSYGPANSNFALLFIIVANVFLYAGFFAVRFKGNTTIVSTSWKPISASRILALMLVSLIYGYFTAIYWTPDEEPRIVSLIGIFISPQVILLMALSYLVLFARSLSKKAAFTIAALLVLDIIVHTLGGSRSGIITLAQNVLLVVLAISGAIKIQRKTLLYACVLAPPVLVLIIGSFMLSTFNRAHKDAPGSLGVNQALELAGQARGELGTDTGLDIVLPPIFDRAGFFDYSAEIIAHREQYKDVFRWSSYAKSIVDNLLTPGFDVYDWPKLSNALQFVYQDLGVPSKNSVSELYQSDQFGIYGEFYAVLGYGSLPLFFFVAFLLKRAYARLKNNSPFIFAMKRLVLLAVFIRIIDSYGMDWTIIETVPFVVSIFLYTFFFRSKPMSDGETSTRQSKSDPLPNAV